MLVVLAPTFRQENRHESEKSGVWTTCRMGIVPCGRLRAVAAAEDQADAAIAASGLSFLAARQHADGSYGSDVYQGHVAVTAFVGRAMMASGSKPGVGPYGERL